MPGKTTVVPGRMIVWVVAGIVTVLICPDTVVVTVVPGIVMILVRPG